MFPKVIKISLILSKFWPNSLTFAYFLKELFGLGVARAERHSPRDVPSDLLHLPTLHAPLVRPPLHVSTVVCKSFKSFTFRNLSRDKFPCSIKIPVFPPARLRPRTPPAWRRSRLRRRKHPRRRWRRQRWGRPSQKVKLTTKTASRAGSDANLAECLGRYCIHVWIREKVRW